MASQDDISQFLAITGASADAATFYIDSAGGSVEAAISAFFESGGAGGLFPADQDEANMVDDDPEFVPEEPQAAIAGAAGNSGFGGGSGFGAGAGAGGGSRPKRAAAQGGVRSLGDLQDDSNSEDEGDQSNELYTGGAKSGQVVRGPKKNKDDKGDDVEGLFDRARQAGAVDGTADDLRGGGGGGGGGAGGAFSGAARTLAAGDAPAAPAQPEGEPEAAGPASIVHTITFYADGQFTVDDGEPRDMRDPANAPFMNSIARGECPRELEPRDSSQPVNVNLVRNAGAYEPPPKPAYTAFSGASRTLAGPELAAAAAPPVAAPAAAAPPASLGGSSATTWPGPNESQPVTSIQLRLIDGSRLVARFNLSQTVGDLRKFITASRPDLGSTAYRLAVPFPPAQLTDDAATIQDAGLQNAVVVQKPA